MAEASPRGIDRHRRGTAGGRWRGTSPWKTICSTCSPPVGGRQYRVRGDARARLVDELEASVGHTASGPPPTSQSESTRTDAIFIIPGAALAASMTVGEFGPGCLAARIRLSGVPQSAQIESKRPPAGIRQQYQRTCHQPQIWAQCDGVDSRGFLRLSPWLGETACPDSGPVCARRSDRPTHRRASLRASVSSDRRAQRDGRFRSSG